MQSGVNRNRQLKGAGEGAVPALNAGVARAAARLADTREREPAVLHPDAEGVPPQPGHLGGHHEAVRRLDQIQGRRPARRTGRDMPPDATGG